MVVRRSDSGGQDMTDTTADQIRRAIRVLRAKTVADVMTLGGSPCGAGDVQQALDKLGLRLENGRAVGGTFPALNAANDHWTAAIRDLTDERQCPKCRALVRRLKGNGDRWYHKRTDWGWRRACTGVDVSS